MAYLEQFARNRKHKEKTKVLTVRLPESNYDEFKSYCDSLGLTLSEAINLLVDKELKSNQKEIRSLPNHEKKNDVVYKENTGETFLNTGETSSNTIVGETTTKPKQNVVKPNTPRRTTNTKRFTVKPYVIENELPCPICESWCNASNFSRHAKTLHNSNTEAIFTEYRDKINEMFNNRKAESGDLEG